MKKCLLIILFSILCLNGQAQSAEDFLNKVIEKNKSYNDISINFEYSFYDVESGISDITNSYAYMKGNSYIVKIDDQEMISDGKTLWTHFIDDQEVMISDVTEESNNSPLAIIDSFTQNVNVSFDISENDITTILIEEKEKTTFEIMSISVDKDLKITEISIIMLDKNIITYKIKSFKTNQDLPDSMFIFDEKIHPNVEVIDMR
jgi:chaperone LolA